MSPTFMKTTIFCITVFTGFVRAFGTLTPLVFAATPLTR
jgi:hypothetical protein